MCCHILFIILTKKTKCPILIYQSIDDLLIIVALKNGLIEICAWSKVPSPVFPVNSCIEKKKKKKMQERGREGLLSLPSGIMERVMGSVSNAFLPYTSDRFPISGIITTAPTPIIYNIIINKQIKMWSYICRQILSLYTYYFIFRC